VFVSAAACHLLPAPSESSFCLLQTILNDQSAPLLPLLPTIAGVNRHEHDPRRGKTVSLDSMVQASNNLLLLSCCCSAVAAATVLFLSSLLGSQHGEHGAGKLKQSLLQLLYGWHGRLACKAEVHSIPGWHDSGCLGWAAAVLTILRLAPVCISFSFRCAAFPSPRRTSG
jgi:hypothetical protein